MARKPLKSLRAPADFVPMNSRGGERSSTFFAGLAVPLDEFIRSQSTRLAQIASRLKLPPDKIADVVQAVWLDAAQNRVTFSGEHADRERCAWLNRVVLRRSADALRSLQRHKAQSLDAEPVDEKAKDAPTLLEVKERDARLAAALAALLAEEPLNGWLLVEHFLDGRSIQDLAEETGLTVHAIYCRNSRALTKLRDWL